MRACFLQSKHVSSPALTVGKQRWRLVRGVNGEKGKWWEKEQEETEDEEII